MSDLPAGQWSALLVGNQWPGFSSLATLSAAATNRASISEAFEAYADSLRTIRNGSLGEQEGVTADDTRQAFQTGEYSAQKISEVNAAKKGSYESARNATEELRSDLRTIAEQGNTDIDEIVASKAPPPVKAAKIAVVVTKAQEQASIKAASHSQGVLDAIDQVFAKSGIDLPARQFAEQQGVDLANAFRPQTKDQVLDQVQMMLNKTPLSQDSSSSTSSANSQAGNGTDTSSHLLRGEATFSSTSSTGENSTIPGMSEPGTTASGAPSTVNGVSTSRSEASFGRTPASSVDPYTQTLPGTGAAGVGSQQNFATSPSAASPGAVAGPQIPTSTSTPGVSTGGSPPTTSSASSLPSVSASAPTNALSPEGFAQNFNSGAQAGGPLSSGAEGLSNTAAHAMQPQAPIHPESMAAPPAYTTPSAGAPLFETAHAAPTYDTAQAPVAPPADTTQTYMA
ncbi:hypothetical protein, partial [Mycolicibacterium vinylchloridicum]|uniref:hypothetical protein n=1 Tax=Mycolicibacterium vinylchloridicum TaxID=2736928 RepID=UPI0015CBD4A3